MSVKMVNLLSVTILRSLGSSNFRLKTPISSRFAFVFTGRFALSLTLDC